MKNLLIRLFRTDKSVCVTIPILLAITFFFQSPAGQAAEVIKSKTTYSQAYGTTKNPVTLDPTKDLPHYPAVEPVDAIKTWKVKPGFKLQLAAHEPQVRDPIAICFDERGRMFACEMIDYSEMRDSSPHLGRVSVLEDRDGDGYYETSQVFADNLPWPTGLIWANGGLYVGATPDIWRFEDRDADGRAEVREKIYSGFGSGLKMLNVQGLLNSFQWGQDNRVHVLAGGGNRGIVTCLKRPELPGQELSGRDFWFDPLTHEFGMETGGAQYGMSFDNYGRKFGCSNSDHLQHWVYEGDSGGHLPPARKSIAVDGGAAEVFRRSPDEPWRIVRTRWRIAGTVPGMVEGGGRVSGYFTGATGTTIFRGDAYGPDFVNNSFTGDAGGQLVHRKIIRSAADGVNRAGERPADEQGFEFAASNDTWVRIVNFANAPDGCLHIIDMYREVIEHPWSIPDEIKKHLDLNHGNDRGRIYRLVPDVTQTLLSVNRIGQKIDLSGVDVPGLVKLLSHPNGWHRDTAQRLLHERQDKTAIPLLEVVISGNDPLAKIHALGALASQKAISEPILIAALGDADAHVRERALVLSLNSPLSTLNPKIAALSADSSPRVRFQLARTISSLLKKNSSPELEAALTHLAEQDHDHPWISPALLTAPPALLSSRIFSALTGERVFEPVSEADPFIARLIEIRAATSSSEDRVELIDWIASRPNPLWIGALGEGLRQGKSSIEKADKNQKLTALFKQSATTVLNNSQLSTINSQLTTIELLRFASLDISQPALLACLAENQPEALQTAALKILAQHVSPQVDQLILQNWPHYTAQARTTALEQMLARQDRQITLLAAIKSGTIPAAALSAAQVQSLVQHKETQIASLAKEALAAVIPPSRAEVAAKFRDAVTTPGDALRGQTQFMQRCLICHRAAGMGLEVGPDLVTVKAKGREALLSAILEPGKEVAAQYILYTVNTRDGGTYAGVIAEDNATAMTLKMAGGATHKIERPNIKGSSSSGQSLMPDGLEAGMTVQDMADLLTFIEELK